MESKIIKLYILSFLLCIVSCGDDIPPVVPPPITCHWSDNVSPCFNVWLMVNQECAFFEESELNNALISFVDAFDIDGGSHDVELSVSAVGVTCSELTSTWNRIYSDVDVRNNLNPLNNCFYEMPWKTIHENDVFGDEIEYTLTLKIEGVHNTSTSQIGVVLWSQIYTYNSLVLNLSNYFDVYGIFIPTESPRRIYVNDTYTTF